MTDPAASHGTDGPDGLDVFGPPPLVPGAETPGPAYAEASPVDARLAHPAARAFAFFLDGVTTVLIVFVIVIAGLGSAGFELFWAIPLVPLAATILDTVLTAVFGVTPAKALLGLRVVDAGSGAPIGAGRAILRSLVIIAPIGAGVVLAGATVYLPYELQNAFGGGFGFALFVPAACWVALLVVLAVRPRHRGLQDLAGRSVVVVR